MAARYWKPANTNWDDITNWSSSSGGVSGASVPTSADDVTFDANSVAQNCVLATAANVKTLTFTTGWTKTFNMNSQTLTSVGSITFDGAGAAGSTFTLAGTIIMTGDGNLSFNAGIATLTITSCILDIRGTGTITQSETNSAGNAFISLTCAYSGKTTTVAGGQNFCFRTLNVGSGTLTNNMTSSNFQLNPTESEATTFLNLTAGYTWNGTGTWFISLKPTTDTLTYTLPAINYTGSGVLTIWTVVAFNTTITMQGHISLGGGATIYETTAQNGNTFIFNLNNYNFTCGALVCGCQFATGTMTYNWGTGNISIASLAATYNTGTTNFNMSTSQWSCGTAWTFGSTWTVDCGTSSITFTSAGTLTTAGKTLYDIIVTGGTRTVTYAGTSNFNSFAITGATGALSIAVNNNITVDKYFYHDGSGSCTFNSILTITTGIGSDDCFRLSANIAGAPSMATFQIDVKCSGFININKAIIILNITIAYSSKTNKFYGSTTSVSITFSSAGVLTLATGSFEQNQSFIFSIPSITDFLVIGAGTWNGTGNITINPNSAQNFNLPAITYTGSGTFSIFKGSTGSGSPTCTMTGNFSWSGTFIVSNFLTGQTLTFTTSASNYSITCGDLRFGITATYAVSISFNASVISCSSAIIGASIMTGSSTVDMGSSTWTVSGSWTWGTSANLTVTLGTCSITITNTATITGAVKNFYTLILNASGKVITWATGNCTIQDCYIEPGTTVDFFAGMTYTFTTYTDTAWDGSAGNLVTIRSTTWGTAVNFTFPASQNVHYIAVMDNTISNPVTTAGQNNVNLGGNNVNWGFGTRFWIGGDVSGTTDWSISGNWATSSSGVGGASVPTSADDVVFDGGSNGYNCTMTANSSCKSLMTTSAWTKNFSMGGFTLTSVNAVEFYGTGTLTFDSTLTMTGDGTFEIASGVGTITATSMSLVLQGNCLMNPLKNALNLLNFTCSYSGKTVKIGDTAGGNNPYLYIHGVLTVGNSGASGTLSINTQYFYLCQSTESTPLVQHGTPTYTAVTSGRFYFTFEGTSQTINFPALTLSAQLAFYVVTAVGASGTNTFNMAGNISVGQLFGIINNHNGNHPIVFNTNNYSLTTSTGTAAYGISIGTTTGSTVGRSIEVNFGSSVISTGVFSAANDDQCTVNFGTCTLSCGGNFTLGTDWDFDAGTSQITFNTGTATVISCAGHTLYNVIVAKTSNVNVSLGDNFSANSLVVNSGASGNFTVTPTDFSITLASTFSFNSTGTLRVAAVTINGDGDFIIGSATGTVTLTNAAIEMKGTGSFQIDKASLTFVSVKFNGSGKTISVNGTQDWTTGRLYITANTTVRVSAGRTIAVTTYTSGDIAGSSGNLVVLNSLTSDSQFTLTLPATMTGGGNTAISYINVKDSIATNPIYVNDGTSTNGGNNNANWIFSSAPVILAFKMQQIMAYYSKLRNQRKGTLC